MDLFTYDPYEIMGDGLDDPQDVRGQLLPPEPPWLPRSQEDDRLTAASHDAGLIEEQDGDSVSVPTEGDYHLQVWGQRELTQSNGTIARVRKTLVPMRCVKVLARCTQMGLPETTEIDERLTPLIIDESRPDDDNTAPRAVVVGYSGITGYPVFASTPKESTIRNTIDMSDNSKGISFRAEPMKRLAGGNVIWHETCTVLGNIGAIKRLIVSNNRHLIDDDDVVSTITHQHKRLNLGLSFEPPAHHKAAEDGE
ncbi:hypothetical protein FPSE5266_20169 [Fusarium pseudograminearum]|nr:hypothetical protein FPSE5266_20169 [Fusarium pseudograminearum]